MTEVTIKDIVRILCAGIQIGNELTCTLDDPAETAKVWDDAKRDWLASGTTPESAHYLIEELKAWWAAYLAPSYGSNDREQRNA